MFDKCLNHFPQSNLSCRKKVIRQTTPPSVFPRQLIKFNSFTNHLSTSGRQKKKKKKEKVALPPVHAHEGCCSLHVRRLNAKWPNKTCKYDVFQTGRKNRHPPSTVKSFIIHSVRHPCGRTTPACSPQIIAGVPTCTLVSYFSIYIYM